MIEPQDIDNDFVSCCSILFEFMVIVPGVLFVQNLRLFLTSIYDILLYE